MASEHDEVKTGNGTHRSSADIRHDIQRTRAELDTMVRALEERLKPRRLVWEMRRQVEPEVRAAAQKVVLEYRRHRPAVLAGAAAVLGLLVAGALGKRRKRRRRKAFPPEQRGL